MGDGNEPWERGVLDNIRITDTVMEFKEGINELVIGALSPGFVLEKIIIFPEGTQLPYSYLGPSETFRVTP